MGYSTNFVGELRFAKEVTSSQLATLKKICSATFKDRAQGWVQPLYYLDLKVSDAATGLVWSGAEKTYELDTQVNAVLDKMREQWPDFGLQGQFDAQGEDLADHWTLPVGEGGLAQRA